MFDPPTLPISRSYFFPICHSERDGDLFLSYADKWEHSSIAGHGQPGLDGPTRPKKSRVGPKLAIGPGSGLEFEPGGRARPGSSLRNADFKQRSGQAGRAQSSFFRLRTGLGPIFRPDDRAWVIITGLFSARPEVCSGIHSSHIGRVDDYGWIKYLLSRLLMFWHSISVFF